jgi:hypothetical protein
MISDVLSARRLPIPLTEWLVLGVPWQWTLHCSLSRLNWQRSLIFHASIASRQTNIESGTFWVFSVGVALVSTLEWSEFCCQDMMLQHSYEITAMERLFCLETLGINQAWLEM